MNNIQKFIQGLYPTTKLYFVLFVLVSVFVVPGYAFAYATVILGAFLALLAGKIKTFLNLVIKALLPIVILIFLLQSLFYPGETIVGNWWIFSIKQEGIYFSLILTSRILAIGSAFILYFSVTTIKDFVFALEEKGLSPKATYVILSTLSIIPEMRKMSRTIMDAQRSRGVETEGNLRVRAKAFLPTLSPLILGSIASTEERVMTLEARAFTVKGKKTRIHQLEKTKKDTLVKILLLLLLMMVIGWRLLLWVI